MIRRTHLLLIALGVAMIAWGQSGCYRTRLVPVEPRPCITRPFTRPPMDAAPGSPRWLAAYRAQVAEMQAAEMACGIDPPCASPATTCTRPTAPAHVTDGGECWCAPTITEDGIAVHREGN